MNTKSQENPSGLIDRYVYAVTKYLPSKQKEDIGKEIRTLIDDMSADMYPGNEGDMESIRGVLTELGDPHELAGKYQETKRYLIGPDYFDIYIFILKIIIAAVTGGLLIALIIQNIVAPPDNPFIMAGEVVSTITSALFGVFTSVTIIFALISYYSGSSLKSEISKIKEENKWTIEDLPEIPDRKAVIKKSEPIASIIFQILFFILLNYAPQIIGILFFQNDRTYFIPFLNLDNINSFLILINIIILIGIVKEVARLLEGRHTLRLSIGTGILGCVSLILTVLLITNQQFWNPDFVTEFNNIFGDLLSGTFDIALAASITIKVIIGLAIFGFIAETASNFYKAIRYGEK